MNSLEVPLATTIATAGFVALFGMFVNIRAMTSMTDYPGGVPAFASGPVSSVQDERDVASSKEGITVVAEPGRFVGNIEDMSLPELEDFGNRRYRIWEGGRMYENRPDYGKK